MTTKKLICSDGVLTDDLFQAVNQLSEPVSTMVMLGASIMNSAFDTALDVDRVKAQYGFATTTVVDECVPGDTTADLLSRLPAILTTYSGQSGIVFPMSIGGNNVSDTRPYATATEQQLADMSGDIQAIIDLIQGEGHQVIYSNISFRNYSGTVPPYDEGSLPYNTDIVEPIIRTKLKSLWDYTNNVPYFDVYTFTLDNPSYLLPDGIHLTAEGEEAWRHYWFSQLAKFLRTETVALSAPSGSRIVIDFNDEGSHTQTNPRITANGAYAFTANTVTNLEAVSVGVYDRAGLNNSGNGNSGDVSTSLTNDVLLLTSLYSTTEQCTVLFQGMEEGATGTLTVTASRATNTGDRVGEYTVQGVTLTMDAEVEPAPQAAFAFVADEYGTVTLTFIVQSGSAFAYLNGAEIVFD